MPTWLPAGLLKNFWLNSTEIREFIICSIQVEINLSIIVHSHHLNSIVRTAGLDTLRDHNIYCAKLAGLCNGVRGFLVLDIKRVTSNSREGCLGRADCLPVLIVGQCNTA